MAFGFATYPGLSLRQPKTWALAGLVALGPLGKVLARGLYRAHRRRSEARQG